MTRDEARALLVEQGALMLEARLRATTARRAMKEARSAWVEAAVPLVTGEFLEHEFTQGEEERCFEESIERLGYDPRNPLFDLERKAFRRQREERVEQQLIAQRDHAEMN